MNREALARPFDRRLVRHRAGPRGRTVPYVEVAAVVERLNAEVPSWSYEVVSHDVYDDREVVVLGRLSVPADGIVKMAFGTAELTRDRDGNVPSKGAAIKAAASDGLKKAASLLGVGLEFYRKESTPEERPAATRRLEVEVHLAELEGALAYGEGAACPHDGVASVDGDPEASSLVDVGRGQTCDLLIGPGALAEPEPELGEDVSDEVDDQGDVGRADLADGHFGMSHASRISARTRRSVKGVGCPHASSSLTPSSGSSPPTPWTRMMSTRMSKSV